MQYRILGRTGLKVSEVGLGGAPFGIKNYMGTWDPYGDDAQEIVTSVIERALELGYNYIDTAPGYGEGRSEEMIGKALKGKRKGIVIATKVTTGMWKPDEIKKSVESSLKRLQTDTIDILQFHGGWYNKEQADMIFNQGGLETFLSLKQEGIVRFIGFTAEGPTGEAEKLIETGAFDAMQIRFNIMYGHPSDWINDTGIIRKADAQDMGIIVMRPMTSGIFQKLLTGSFPEIQAEDAGKLLLNYVLSDSHIDVALIGMRDPAFVDINNSISDDISSRLNMKELYNRWP